MTATPTASLAGGFLLSFATSTLALSHGRILGCSGIAHAAVAHLATLAQPAKDHPPATSSATSPWKLASLAGFVAGGALLALVRPSIEHLVQSPLFDPPATLAQHGGLARVVLAGLLVGAGTKVRLHAHPSTTSMLTASSTVRTQLANGCTSGHMLLGLSRFSRRSLAAVLTFFSFALLTARLAPHPLAASFSLPAPLAPLAPSSPSPLATLALLLLGALASLLTAKSDTLHSFFLSVTFTLGLSLAGMLRPSKVLSFFYLPLPLPWKAPAAWDPSLAFVALGGLVPNALIYHTRTKHERTPLVKGKEWTFERDPTTRAAGSVDGKLVGGSALFGIGWGAFLPLPSARSSCVS